MSDIIARLRSSEPLPACPYDKLSPHYLTAPDDKPCAVCGGLNEPGAPDLCRGADTRVMSEAADIIEKLREALTPFEDIAAEGSDDFPDSTKVTVQFGRTTFHALTLGDLRRVGAAITAGDRDGA